MGEWKQQALNTLVKGAGITAIAIALSKILTYLFRIVVARFEGPEAYGQISLALMAASFAGTISLLAVNKSLKKYIPEFRVDNEKRKIKGIVLSTLHITLPLSLIASIILFTYAGFIAENIFESPELTILLQIVAWKPFFSNLAAIYLDTTIGYNKIIYRETTRKIVQNTVQLTIATILIIAGYGVAGAALGSLIGVITAAILGLYFLEKKVGPVIFSKVKPDYQHKKVLKYSSPLIIAATISTVMSWADIALVGYFMDDASVGVYNAALPTAALVLIPLTAMSSLSVSGLSELAKRDNKNLETTLKTSTYWIFSLVFPTFLILTLFSSQTLNLLFGSEYTVAATALTILALGYLANGSVGLTSSFLKSSGHTKPIMYTTTVALITNIGLNIILIPIYGIIGAAIATSSSIIILNLLNYSLVWKLEGINTVPRKIWKPGIIAAVSLGTIYLLTETLFATAPAWLLIPAGITFYTIYVILFIKLIGLNDEEEKILLKIGEKIGQKQRIDKVLEMLE